MAPWLLTVLWDHGSHTYGITEVSYKLKFSGTFSDSLDLERLPYDRQLLRIQARFDMQGGAVELT